MRGKEKSEKIVEQNLRITPAYAGKSFIICKYRTDQKDHPRLCGEKFITTWVMLPSAGSPPPMRGKVNECSVNNR